MVTTLAGLRFFLPLIRTWDSARCQNKKKLEGKIPFVCHWCPHNFSAPKCPKLQCLFKPTMHFACKTYTRHRPKVTFFSASSKTRPFALRADFRIRFLEAGLGFFMVSMCHVKLTSSNSRGGSQVDLLPQLVYRPASQSTAIGHVNPIWLNRPTGRLLRKAGRMSRAGPKLLTLLHEPCFLGVLAEGATNI